jgi:hypothetical protein|nr:hypothetical protein [Caenimonas soli]
MFLLCCLPLLAMAAESPEDIKKDAQRHRAMAAAHDAAAKCLESGKKHDQCQKELQAACKGLAIGKYCGMKHEH